ncbi:MAG: hypothetical protein ACK5AZ_09525 [Bryobacteraceae bacterium]
MITRARFHQAAAVARLELGRVFFSKRSFWVYLLALFPAIVFLGHGMRVELQRKSYTAHGIVQPAVLDEIRPGDSDSSVLDRAGVPIHDRRWGGRGDRPPQRQIVYFDGRNSVTLHFDSGLLTRKSVRPLASLDEDREAFAAVFHHFYLRLAIFFGCLGIFMNLFRGEMLDKTLHYWFLAPVRREVLLAGKYLAGLAAAVVIFTGAAVLCYGLMLWPQDPGVARAHWQTIGPSHLFWYAAAAALACVGYGSVFLAAGLLVRNPIVPAVILLLWEGINGFLPDLLQKLSVIYYAQSLCPIPPPMDPDAPLLVRLLLAPAEPASAWTAILGILAVAALVLWSASRAVRRLEINYGTD